MNEVPTILVIGGSDSSGGAGIQADCAMARSQGVMPVCAISCVTSQGISGLARIESVSPEMFESQLEIAFKELNPQGIKIGMIHNEVLIDILISFLEKYKPEHVVLDPVMGPSRNNGHLTGKMWNNLPSLNRIAPYVELITPNLPEALSMLNRCDARLEISDVKTRDDLLRIAQELHEYYNFKNILLKAGHVDAASLPDCLYVSKDKSHRFYEHERVITQNTHGTGCALSTAILCRLILLKNDNLFSACNQGISILHKSLVDNQNNMFYSDENAYGPAFFE